MLNNIVNNHNNMGSKILFKLVFIDIVTGHAGFLLCRIRACSYDPAYRDVSLTEMNISVRSYGIFRPACRDEITL
jgi:hypothetical protein